MTKIKLPEFKLRNIRKRKNGYYAVRINRKTKDRQKAMLIREFLSNYLNGNVGVYETCSKNGETIYNVQTFKEFPPYKLEEAIRTRDFLENELHMKIGL